MKSRDAKQENNDNIYDVWSTTDLEYRWIMSYGHIKLFSFLHKCLPWTKCYQLRRHVFLFRCIQSKQNGIIFKGSIIVDYLSNAFSDENPSILLAWSEDLKYIVQII